jgi:glycosyltransferase 2 family protein
LKAEDSSDTPQLFGKGLVRKLMLPIGLAVIAYAALLFYGDTSGIVRGLEALPASVVVWALLISAGSFTVRGVRWLFYLSVMKIRVPLGDAALLFLAGLGMSITPGKTGELLKSLLLKERHDVPVARSGPIIVAERLTDLGALLLLAFASIFWAQSPVLVIGGSLLFVSALFAFGRSQRLGAWAIGLLALLPVLRKFKDKLMAAHASLRELWSFSVFSIAMLLAIVAWGLQAFTVTVFATALNESLSLPGALIAFSAPLLAGTLALLPGGLGLTEASMAGALRALSTMSATAAATITILTRLVTFWFAIVIGFSGLFVWRLRQRRAVAVGA